MKGSEARIFVALVISLAVHGAIVFSDYGSRQSPVAGIARKKVSFRLVARQAPEPRQEMNTVEQPPPLPVEPLRKEAAAPPAPVKKAVPVQPKAKPVLSAPEPVRREVTETAVEVQQPAVPEREVRETEPVAVAESVQPPEPAEVLARPLYRQSPPPSYPNKARRRQLEGTVILEVLVNAMGGVDELKVKESSGHEVLDRAALAAVKAWMFEPGRRNGLAVAMKVLVPVRFELKSAS